MGVSDRYRLTQQQPIDRDDLLVSDVPVEDFDADLPAVLRPAFDSVWQAAGWPRSMNYDEQGNWKPPPIL